MVSGDQRSTSCPENRGTAATETIRLFETTEADTIHADGLHDYGIPSSLRVSISRLPPLEDATRYKYRKATFDGIPTGQRLAGRDWHTPIPATRSKKSSRLPQISIAK